MNGVIFQERHVIFLEIFNILTPLIKPNKLTLLTLPLLDMSNLVFLSKNKDGERYISKLKYLNVKVLSSNIFEAINDVTVSAQGTFVKFVKKRSISKY